MSAKKANRIRKFRLLKGLSQKALAKKAGTSQQQLQRIESGKQSARYDVALRICAALDVRVKQVFPQTEIAVRTIKPTTKKGQTPLPSGPSARVLWADATDLEVWTKRVDAPALLPELIRRLAWASLTGADQISFRSKEGIRFEGWDGLVRVSAGNAFVPAGISGWEMGTSEDIKGKADDDYAKRSTDPLGLDPASTTFVFVTPRRWKNKDKWSNAKRGEEVWKDVRVLDADDLAAWLEQFPSAHIWFSTLVGKRSGGVDDLLAFWQNWSGVTQPMLTPEVLIAGREDTVAEIQSFIRGRSSVLGLQAATLHEAVAFVAAAIQVMPEAERQQIMARAIVVDDEPAWKQLVATTNPLILIPTFSERETITNATTAGHFVVIPLGQDEAVMRGAIQLARLPREGVKKALQDMGIGNDRAQELAGLARRSMGALRRALAISPSVLMPGWAAPQNARPLLPALLAGKWSASSVGDQQALAQLAGLSYPHFEDILIRWANEHDPPVRRIGDTWMFLSKEDGWHLLARYVSRDDLERFQSVAIDVLGEYDPKYDLPENERWQAAVKGKTLKRSDLLRKGLAETLAVMGAYSNIHPISDPWTGQDWAIRIVQQLFDQAKDWVLWASLSSYLRIVAEAAPDVFLSAVEAGLSGPDPKLAKLFMDSQNHMFSGSPHTGLLWALEVLAWSPEYLGPSSLCLAKLARLDHPPGKLRNRPINSLREVFLNWYPGTSANLDQRLGVLDVVRKREPTVAWTLLASLLPKGHDSATPTAKPTWREWSPEQVVPRTSAQIYRGAQEIVRRLLEDVGYDGSRWHDLIEALDDLPKPEFDTIIERLHAIDLHVLPPMNRMRIWGSLRHLISRHLQFPDANWVLPKEAIGRLQEVHPRFEPDDPLAKRKGLFSYHPDLLIAGHADWKDREKAIEQAQVKAVEDLFELGDISIILELAKLVDCPHLLGLALGRSKILDGEEHRLLNQGLGSSIEAWRDMGLNFLCARSAVKGPRWAESLRSGDFWQSWSPQQRADYFRCLPFTESSSWDALEVADAETQRLYWTKVGPFGHGQLSLEYCQTAVKKFVQYGALGSALKMLDFYTHGKDTRLPVTLVVEVLEQCMRAPSRDEINWISMSHDIGELLDFIEKSGEIADERLASLEWFFLPVIGLHGRPPRKLHKALAQDPHFFMEVLKLIYRAEREEPTEVTQEQEVRGRLAYDLLYSWGLPPGMNKDDTVSSERLEEWVTKVRELAKGSDRLKVADHRIGNILSHYPIGADGAWPHEALRDLLEELENEDIEEGIRIGLYNSRGVVHRSMTEGGRQERAISDLYQGYALILNVGWPRTARLIRKIAQVYEADARREDIETEIREDLWD